MRLLNLFIITCFLLSYNTSVWSNPSHRNRLASETSAYLLEHADNPVDWYAWNEEALSEARNTNKLIFLSVGFASCHWCHVMEKESFSNPEIANLLNDSFISIKVDREQRPDIDAYYGDAVIMLNGQLGWPMTVILSPDARPFYAGNYFNKADLEILLKEIKESWKEHPEKIVARSVNVADELNASHINNTSNRRVGSTERKQAIQDLLSIVDDFNGGFGESNKFPREPWLLILLDESYGGLNQIKAFDALKLTLTKMADGGIYDHLSGGFHRYSIDPYWNVPHFEKMLYNQALLTQVYLKANDIENNDYFLNIAEKTVEFLLTNMRDKKGGFYASINSESEGIEGKYYTWSLNEVSNLLTSGELDIVRDIYNIDTYGDIADQKNVIFLSTSIEEYAASKGISVKTIRKKLQIIDNKLIARRELRIKPDIDKKIIMGWNGLTITALTEAYLHFNRRRYLDAAIHCARYIWEYLQVDGIFFRTNESKVNDQLAQLDDLAYYLQALITLYDSTKQDIWLSRAVIIADMMIADYWDADSGGFYSVSLKQKLSVPIRQKIAFDKELPAANAIASQMLMRLSKRTHNLTYLQKSKEILRYFYRDVVEVPSAYTGLLIASNEMDTGKKDLPLYDSAGNIHIDAYIELINENKMRLITQFIIDEGWHINSNSPLMKGLIPFEIKLKSIDQYEIESIKYPNDKIVKLEFSDRDISVYNGENKVETIINKKNSHFSPVININFQACNDTTCLPPESLTLYPRIVN